MAYNRLRTMRDNIEAIRLVLRLGVAGRTVQNAEERETLRKYAGFGGLKCILNEANDLEDAAKWSKTDIELFAPTVELRRLIHDYSKDDKEFARYMDSLKASVLTAFYTPAPVIDAISGSLKQSGIEVRRFLEPSAGQGAFIDSFLRNDMYPGTEVLAYEKDLLTGKILSALHPSILTRIEGFEKIERDFNGYFDVAASNIPFGNFAVPDPAYAVSKDIPYRQASKAIHNYFFLKALDSVREGGLVAFIASQGVMNAASPFIRLEMMKRADIVAALRLPNNTFSDNAGTDAGSDLIILQKHSDKKNLSFDEELFTQSVIDNATKVPGNKFFQAFPQNVICTDAKMGTDQYGKPAIVYTHKEGVDGIARDIGTALQLSFRLRLDIDRYNGYAPKLTPPTVRQETAEKKNEAVKRTTVTKVAPLLDQYREMKKKHPDAILLFRVGDFYEIFGQDAVAASEILGITLTRRLNGPTRSIELAGFPHHALDTYLPKLVRAGQRVAICEQLEDPKHKVVEEITPNNTNNKGVEPPVETKIEQKPAPEPQMDQPPTSEPPATAPTDNPQEIETDGAPDYSGDYDPRLFAYNLFGELEPIGKPQRRHKAEPKNDKTEAKPVSRPKKDAPLPPKAKFRQLTDKELEFYGSLNWDDNPPINGFYEAMMSIAHRQLEERARMEAEAMSAEAAKAAGIAPGETYIEKTEGYFIPGGRNRPQKVTAIPIEGAGLDMSPRKFSEDIQPFHKNGSMVVDNGQVGFLSDVRKTGATFTPMRIKPEQEKRAMLYVTMSETYQQLYDYEAATQEPSEHLREHLNQYYDEFVERYGHLNEKANAKLIMLDANGMDSLALERAEAGLFVKADIFDHPVAFNIHEVTSVDTPMEALAASLNKYGDVRLGYMSSLVDMDENRLAEELKGHIYFNPLVSEYETSDRFIAGNVVKKAEMIEQWIKDHDAHDSRIDESLSALKDAVPRRITFEELDFNFGERWIPTGIYSAYMTHFYDTDVKVVYSPMLDEYSVTNSGGNMKIWEEYCVRGQYRSYDGMSLLKHALHNTVPEIKKCIGQDDHGNDIKVPDSEAIQLANSKIEEIRDGFTEWLEAQSPEFKERLVDLYNRKFNCFVRPRYDGSHQTFPGLNLKMLADRYGIHSIYASQKDCVWMLKQNGGGIADHQVGTGKTLIMCIAAHEMKRLGMVHKPMIIGLKANVADIAMTYQTAYPDARILYADEKSYTAQNRVRFFNNIRNNDYDCIIMSHDQFGKIPQSPEVQQQILQAELDSVEENLNVIKEQGHDVSRAMLKGLIKRKENLTAKIATIQYQMEQSKDGVVDFKQMGIDHIFVDESQNYKNLMFNTRHSRVAGLGNADGSQRSLNLLYAIRTIQERTGKDLGATFLSGTIISNSLTELYLLFKYLRPNELERQEIRSIAAIAASFDFSVAISVYC